MNSERVESTHSIHALGIGYIYTYLNNENYTILEVHSDPDHLYQIIAKRDDELILVAVRTTYHPEAAEIDKITQEEMISESNNLNAIPYFASLAVIPLSAGDLELEGEVGGQDYKVRFDGMSIIQI